MEDASLQGEHRHSFLQSLWRRASEHPGCRQPGTLSTWMRVEGMPSHTKHSRGAQDNLSIFFVTDTSLPIFVAFLTCFPRLMHSSDHRKNISVLWISGTLGRSPQNHAHGAPRKGLQDTTLTICWPSVWKWMNLPYCQQQRPLSSSSPVHRKSTGHPGCHQCADGIQPEASFTIGIHQGGGDGASRTGASE